MLLLLYKRNHAGQPQSGILAGLDLHCCGDCGHAHWIATLCYIITNTKALCCSYKPIFRTTVSSDLQGTSSIFLQSIHVVSHYHYRAIASSVQSQPYYLATVTSIQAWIAKPSGFNLSYPSTCQQWFGPGLV